MELIVYSVVSPHYPDIVDHLGDEVEELPGAAVVAGVVSAAICVVAPLVALSVILALALALSVILALALALSVIQALALALSEILALGTRHFQ